VELVSQEKEMFAEPPAGRFVTVWTPSIVEPVDAWTSKVSRWVPKFWTVARIETRLPTSADNGFAEAEVTPTSCLEGADQRTA
jgi:hypothetical protein